MSGNKVVVSAEKLAETARDLTAAAQVFEKARTSFNTSIANTANPRPWADDATGVVFASYYLDAETGTQKALDDAVKGLHDLAHTLRQMSTTYQSVEESNSM